MPLDTVHLRLHQSQHELAYEAIEYESPKVILQRLAKLKAEIEKGRKELEGMLK